MALINIDELKDTYQKLSEEIATNQRVIQTKKGGDNDLYRVLRPVTFSAWPKQRAAGLAPQDTTTHRLNSEFATDRVGLILPTSLCSGQVAALLAQDLNERWAGRGTDGVNRFIALPHTGTL